ncbi:uncharacterized [Tachysurus ichikawai]
MQNPGRNAHSAVLSHTLPVEGIDIGFPPLQLWERIKSRVKNNALKAKAENEKKRNLSSFQGLHEVNSHSVLSVMFSCPLLVKNEGRKVLQISAGPIELLDTFSREPLKAYYLFRPLSDVLMKTEVKSTQRALKSISVENLTMDHRQSRENATGTIPLAMR